MSSQPEKSSKLLLELGDIIKIIAPDNSNINTKKFFIQYLDDTITDLIDIDNSEKLTLTINDGQLSDESIEQIEILSRDPESGYARQNDLTKGKWITVQLGGDVPTMLNGNITSLEEDMIEVSLWPNNEKIYIDFAYKGIPKDLPIESIRPFTPPESGPGEILSPIKEKSDPEIPTSISEEIDFPRTPPITPDMEDIFETDDDASPAVESVIDVPQERKAQLFSADEVVFGEELEEIDILIDVPESERRYSIENQSNDLLNDLLSTIPAKERTKNVFNSLHTMIERYQQLRTTFSKTSSDGEVGMPDTKGSDYKPLAKAMSDLNMKLTWILPIVKNNKVLYNFELDVEDTDSGITETTLAEAQEGIYDIIQQYKGNIVPDGQNKYIFKYRELNPYLTPFREPSVMSNVIINKETQTGLNVILNNDLDMQSIALCGSLPGKASEVERIPIRSSKVSGIHMEKSKFLMSRYERGLTEIKPKDIRLPSLNTDRTQVTPNDTMSILGTLTLPEAVMRYSQINLPTTSVYKRAILNKIPFTYRKFLNNTTKYKSNIIEQDNLDSKEPLDRTDYLKEIEGYIFEDSGSIDDRGNTTFKKYLNKIIPRTRDLFNLIKKFIVNTTSYLSIIEYLQPFLVFPDDISFKQYETIVRYMVDEILSLKKMLAGNRQKFIEYVNFKYETNVNFKNSYLFGVLKIEESDGQIITGKDITNKYNIKTASTCEFIKKLLVVDNGVLFMNALALEDIELFVTQDIEQLIKTELAETGNPTGDSEGVENIAESCKNFVLAKFYLDIDDLRGDDGTTEVYFDDKYDETRYDIINEFDAQQANLSSDEFNKFLIQHLEGIVGLDSRSAAQEAAAIILKKRRVTEGDYAYIVNSDNESIYYIRDDNNTWIAAPDMDGESPSRSTFCNLKKRCLSINNDCGDIVINKQKIKKQLIEDMLEQFDNTVRLGNRALLEELTKDLAYNMNVVTRLIKLQSEDRLKYDIMKKIMGIGLGDRVTENSPHALLRDLILSQEDFVSKQTDILKFINKVCRPAQPIAGENENWFYCADTDIKLLPTFYESLANSFFSQSYESELARIVASRGEVSGDGDKIVDKHSGYLIRQLEFDESEGYDETGYKIVSRALVDQDIGDILINMSFKPTETLRSKDGIMIRNVITTLNTQLDINIGSEIDFIVHNVEAALDAYLPSQKAFEEERRRGNYLDIHDEALLLMTLAYYLVVSQTMMPSIKTSKTFKGCGPRSFVGYPVDGDGDYESLKYIACVALRLRSRTRPWQRLPKLTRSGAVETLKKFMQKMKLLIDKELLTKIVIQDKINAKRAYDDDEDPDAYIPKEFDVRNWITFLPPLHPIKIVGLSNIGPTFRAGLTGEIKSGSREQFTRMATLYGKITLFSLQIQEMIQRAVNKSVLLLENINNELLIENACCNDGNKNTVLYFEEKENGILRTNEIVNNLEDLYNSVQNLTIPSFLYDPTNTKLLYPSVPNIFSKETIYRAFIRFCYFNTGKILGSRIQMICGKNSSNFKNTDNISKKISILESEDRVFSMQSFLALMDIVNKDNILDINLSTTIYSPRAILENYIKNDTVLRMLESTDLINFMNSLESLFDRYDVLQESDEDEMKVLGEFESFLNRNINSLMVDISNFLRSDGGGIDMDYFIADIDNWKLRGENIYMSKEDETAVTYADWSNTAILNILKIFPTIIHNMVSFDTPPIPSHWKTGSQKLSNTHVKDIQKIIKEEFGTLKTFYGNPVIKAILTNVMDAPETDVIVMLLKIFPFFADVRLVSGESRVATILNGPIIKKIMKYLTLYSLNMYISKTRSISLRDNQSLGVFNSSLSAGRESTIADQIIEGRNMQTTNLVGNLLNSYLLIMERDKNGINISNYQINQDVLKSKEKEKAKITKRLGDLSVDERRVEDIMKEHRLGKWGVGQTRALYIYDENQYDKERHELETDALDELRINGMDGVTERTRDIYRMEHLEGQLIDDRIQRELNNDMMALADDDDFGEREGVMVGY